GASPAGDVSGDRGYADAIRELFKQNRKTEFLLQRQRQLKRKDRIAAGSEKVSVAVEVLRTIQQSRPRRRNGLLDFVVRPRIRERRRPKIQAMDLVLESSIADRRRKLKAPHLAERRSRHVPPVNQRDRLRRKPIGRRQDSADLGRDFGERKIANVVDGDEYREGLSAGRLSCRGGAVQWRRIRLGEFTPRFDRVFNLLAGIFPCVD